MNPNSIMQTSLNIPGVVLYKRGKVRDVYDLGEHLLIVSTDRLSAFDVIMKEPIPEKGKILTTISSFWFQKLKDIVPNHFVSTDFLSYYPFLETEKEQLQGRSMIVNKAKLIPYECIVRGYLLGSAYRDYQKTGTISGYPLPEGLHKGSRLETPIFTPSTKAEEGHDENISFDSMKDNVGDIANTLQEYSLKVFQKASEYALSKGIIIADTKIEFGFVDDQIIIIDELFTPDSSRFILQEDYDQGFIDKSMDKEYIRAYLASLEWDQKPPPPSIPPDVIAKTKQRYDDITNLLLP
jgi:phosphoribosylaminoimidazole-succinocarboxamide synthase